MIIGLTGGAASGKSAAADELLRLGARVLDADELSHFLTRYDPTVREALRARFGSAVFSAHGLLDRAALARRVFTDANERTALERILHPPIMGLLQASIVAARQDRQRLVVVIPLLYEGGFDSLFDEVWVIASKTELQVERLTGSRGLSSDEAQRLIAAQMSLEQKQLRADRVIVNNMSLAELGAAVRALWEGLGEAGEAHE